MADYNTIIDDPKIVREKIQIGIDIAEKVVGSSLGPLGRNTGIDTGLEAISIHDGVNIFRTVIVEDAGVNWAIRVLRQAANKQVQEVGDGTTVVTILGHAIYSEAAKIVAAGVNPMLLRESLEEGGRLLVERLKEIAIPLKTEKQKIEVATISAEDKELGELIGKEMHLIGLEGILSVEESGEAKTTIEHQEGLQFDKGYKNELFITQRNEATIENASILVTDRTIINLTELLPLFQKLQQQAGNKPANVVIIAQDITNSALELCMGTKLAGKMNILCIQAPGINEQSRYILEDIAVSTGAVLISKDADQRIENVALEQLGFAKRITATKDATLILGGNGKKEFIEQRKESIRISMKDNKNSDWQMEQLKQRLAKLGTGVSVIRVGGHTEIERRDRKEKVLDAIAATRAAMKGGIVPGGETVYLEARKILTPENNDKVPQSFKILYDALEKPFNKLLSNGGFDPGNIRALMKEGQGFDIITGEYTNLLEKGIIDPILVPINAIENAISTAIQLLITEILIVPPKEEKKNG